MTALIYRVAQWLCWAGAGLFLTAGLAAGIGDGKWEVIAKMAWLTAMVLGAGAFCGRRANRARLAAQEGGQSVPADDADLSGGEWVHWEYDADEWERFAITGRKSAHRVAVRLFLAVGACALALTAVVAISTLDLFASAWVSGAGLLAAWLIWGIQIVHARRSFSGQFRQVTIGRAGANLAGPPGAEGPGRFHRWEGWGLELRSVTLKIGDPWVLEFEVSGAGMTSHEVVLPVPWGHEDESRELVERLGGIAEGREVS